MSLRVLFVAPQASEEDAAWEWLAGCRDLRSRRVRPDDVAMPDLVEADVVWVHAAPSPALPLDLLAARAARGGLLLTLRAAGLVAPLGLESVPPNDEGEGRWSHAADAFRVGAMRGRPAPGRPRGMAAYGPHPLFDGLHAGTTSWAPSEGESHCWSCYALGARPAHGRVVALERAGLAQDARRVIAWEYPLAMVRGIVLCVGAHVHFAAPDRRCRPQLEQLMLNALRTAADAGGGRAWWPEPGAWARPDETVPLPDPLDLDGALPEPARDALAQERDAAGDHPFDLAGRRTVLVGRERRGPLELWTHPHRVIAAWDVAADGAPAPAARIHVAPDVIVRALETASRRITETWFVALEHPVAVVEYHAARRGRESVGRAPAAFEIRATLDLRRMWPYAAGSGGDLRFRRSAHGLVAVVETAAGDAVAVLFASRPVELALRGVHHDGGPAVECTLGAPLGVPLRLAFVAGGSREELDRTLRAVDRLGVAGLVRQRATRAQTLREARVALRCDDFRLAHAVEWAKRRLDAALGEVPQVGRSLLAGYGGTQTAWHAARPSSVAFVGREACWSAMALLAAGEHSLPRQILRFLGDRQDVGGRVLHEVTTSGQHHYAAADSTPLFLLLAARYLAWTGDREFLRAVWPRIERAVECCLAHDADGDGLIEHATAGHGFLEDGPLSGADVSVDLAAIWHAALAGIARAADVLGDERTADDCRARAARALETLGREFHDQRRGLLALDLRDGGTRSWRQTALHAVPFLLGAADHHGGRRWFDLAASDAMSTPWGVRLLPSSDRLFDPLGAHAGAVRPVLTGWVSLAEYRAGRAAAAFAHLAANADLAFRHQYGAFDDVLHGASGTPLGVCGDRAVSAAMVLAPFVEGLLGVEPDAPAGRLTVGPALPAGWTWMEARGVRCGDSVFDVRVTRRGRSTALALRRTLGPPLWLTVAPLLEAAPAVVTVDGHDVAPVLTAVAEGVRAAVGFQSGAENEIVYEGG